jgi:hypothetical protein
MLLVGQLPHFPTKDPDANLATTALDPTNSRMTLQTAEGLAKEEIKTMNQHEPTYQTYIKIPEASKSSGPANKTADRTQLTSID